MGLADVGNKPKVVSVDVPTAEKESTAKPTGTRGRPRGSTTTTTRSKKPTPKKAAATIDAAQVSLFIQTMSAVVGTRPNMSAFIITKDEADQLAKPLSNILSKNDAFSEVAGEYADHITLLIAAITIFIPKFLMYKAQQAAAIAQIPKITQEVQHDKTTKASGGNNTATGQNRNTANVQNNGITNFEPTMPYLGSPI
ncbi:hypothetical protein [Lysinibacillus xylanilyticus]|uniref:hypothetical protein n=1 Tax=Lysinibacillus xylanilyticus TaxID=582475 RepID=UPI003D047DCB